MLGASEPRPESLRAVGLAGWAVLLGLGLAWEGFGLVFAREHWPSISDLLRAMSRPVVGRWLLLALWVWVGWHLFVRGWQPLLRGTPASAGPAAAALSVGQIVREVIVPLGVVYATLLGAIALHGRRAGSEASSTERATGGGSNPKPSVVPLIRHVVLTMAAAYVAFVVLILSYYALVAGQTPEFVRAAASGGAFVTFAVGLPGLLLLSGADALRRRRNAGRHSVR